MKLIPVHPHQMHGVTKTTSTIKTLQKLAALLSPVEGVVYLRSEASLVLSGPKRAGVVFRAAGERRQPNTFSNTIRWLGYSCGVSNASLPFQILSHSFRPVREKSKTEATSSVHLLEKYRYWFPCLCSCMRSPSNLVSRKNGIWSINFITWKLRERGKREGERKREGGGEEE